MKIKLTEAISLLESSFYFFTNKKLTSNPNNNLKPTKTNSPAVISSYESYTSVAFEYIMDLEYNGMYYDQEENRKMAGWMSAEIKDLTEQILPHTGKINLDSAKDLIQLLYTDKGFTAPHFTKSGDEAVDSSAILSLCGLDAMNPGKYLAANPDQ